MDNLADFITNSPTFQLKSLVQFVFKLYLAFRFIYLFIFKVCIDE